MMACLIPAKRMIGVLFIKHIAKSEYGDDFVKARHFKSPLLHQLIVFAKARSGSNMDISGIDDYPTAAAATVPSSHPSIQPLTESKSTPIRRMGKPQVWNFS